MNKKLIDQFMKWNSSTNIACCLLTRIEDNKFYISAANTRFTELLKINDFEELEKIIENREHLNQSLSHDLAEEWTVFWETMHCFLDCRCQRIENNVCVLWISAAEQQPTDILSDIPIGIIRMKVTQAPAKLHCTYMNSEALALTGTSGSEASKCFHASDLMHVHSADVRKVEHMLAMFTGVQAAPARWTRQMDSRQSLLGHPPKNSATGVCQHFHRKRDPSAQSAKSGSAAKNFGYHASCNFLERC